MANTSYLTLEGHNQGKIEGDCPQEAYKKSIVIYAIDHTVHIPRDTHTGLPTGQRVHGPLILTKHNDKSSPKLFQALCSGERIKNFELKMTRISDKGHEYISAKILLDNAIVVSIREYKPMTFLAENEPYRDMEEIMFTYEKITWVHLDANGSTMAETEDDWTKPKTK